MVIEYLANEIMERVREIESTGTGDLEEAASRRDARLVDLAFRFKTRESIVRKMGLVKTYNPDIPEGRLKGLIRDALRYTMVCEAQSYSQVVSEVLANLREKGYEFEEKDVKNYWPEYEVYKGINVSLRLGERVLELQFHTDES